MIPVQLPQEPDDYHHRVREEGLAFLQEQGLNPDQIYSRSTFKTKRMMTDGSGRLRSCEYWQLAREDLRMGYHNRCVYTIAEGAIQLQFDSKGDLIAIPSPLFPVVERLSLADTIKKLGLNDDQVKKFRRDCFDDFINPENNYSDQYMKEAQPFVYQYMIAS